MCCLFNWARTMKQSRLAKMKHAGCCCDPFHDHKKKIVWSLRDVTEAAILKHPMLSLEKGDKLYARCRKKMDWQLPLERSSTSTSAESQHEAVPPDEERITIAGDEEMTSTVQDHELSLLNEALTSISQTTVTKRKLQSHQYRHKKNYAKLKRECENNLS